MTNFIVWYAANTDDFQEWLNLWLTWKKHDIFAHPHYLQLYSNSTTEACCAVLKSEVGTVLYPFLLRKLCQESYWDDSMPELKDISSPYGYGGPYIIDSIQKEDLAKQFWQYFDEWAAIENIVSEFIRFSLFDELLLAYSGEKVQKSQNIVRDLDLTQDKLWMDFKHKVRKNVKRAEQIGLEIIVDAEGNYLEEFLTIYESTMNRRDASDYYYFPREYFESINKNLKNHFAYFHVSYHGQIISTELILISAESVYSFLGGTLAEAFELRPNDLLKYEVIKWAKAEGKRYFVLGGGYKADDGILKYKEAFAPNGSIPFYVGQRILNKSIYDNLSIKAEVAAKASDYFPAYRR